jgi:hypothetical protein
MRTCRLLVICLGLAGAANGCGKASPQVTGKITYQGEILKMGEVRFFGAGLSRTALIGPDGTYVVHDCPAGAVKVAVISMKPTGMAPAFGKKGGGSSTLPVPVSAIPEKYNDPETSGLAYELKPGTQKIDISLVE